MQSLTIQWWPGFLHDLAVQVSVSMQLKTPPEYVHSWALIINLVRPTVNQIISQPASEPEYQAAPCNWSSL